MAEGASGLTDEIITQLRQYRTQIDALPAGSLVIKFARGRPATVRVDVDVRNLPRGTVTIRRTKGAMHGVFPTTSGTLTPNEIDD